MNADRIVGMLIRAGLDTVMRHLPRWLARRGTGPGTPGAEDPRATGARERDIAQKMRMTRKLMRWLR